MHQPRAVFRVPLGRVLTVVAIALVVSAVGGLLVARDWISLWRLLPVLILAGFAAWALFWRPRVIVGNDAVTVVNVGRTWQIPFPRLREVSVRYSLTLETDEGRVDCWAASAPGRHHAVRLRREDFLRPSNEKARHARPGEALSTESGAAAFVISQRWRDAETSHEASSTARVKKTWHATTGGVTAVLVAMSILCAAFIR